MNENKPLNDAALGDDSLNSTSPVNTDSPFASVLTTLQAALRGMLFLRFRLPEKGLSWTHFVGFMCSLLLIQFLRDIARIGLSGELSLYGAPGVLFIVPVLAFASWLMAALARKTERTFDVLLMCIGLAVMFQFGSLLLQLWFDFDVFGQLFSRQFRSLEHYMDLGLTIWLALACAIAAGRILEITILKKMLACIVALAFIYAPLSLVYRSTALWMEPYDMSDDATDGGATPNPYLAISSEEIFYLQPSLLDIELNRLKPKADTNSQSQLFLIAMAGYASQDVFMKEVQFLDRLFERRFGTKDHSIRLINNAATVKQLPIASTTSLALSLKRLAAVMEKDKDILFMYLSSHGSKEHEISLDFGAMRFKTLDPIVLKKMLDESGIVHRVIVISACYSGGFIESLKNDNTLIITSASADKTSFGCSNEADSTYFGKAFFEDALSKTFSFSEAFEIAKPAIAAREEADNYTPSDPQMFVGAKIKDVLDKHAQQSAQLEQSRSQQKIAESLVRIPQVEVSKGSMTLGKQTNISKPDPALQLAAQKVVSRFDFQQLSRAQELQCRAQAADLAHSVFKSDPSYFGGLNPHSPEWPTVLKIYQEFFDETCAYTDDEALTDIFAKMYANNFTENELRKLGEFYSSPLGVKSISVNNQANLNFQKAELDYMNKESISANARFYKKLTALIESVHRAKAKETKPKNSWWDLFKG